MTIKKKTGDEQPEGGEALQIGVSPEEAKDAKAASNEVKDVEVEEFVPADDDGLEEPPEGVVVANADMSLVSNQTVTQTETSSAHVFGDEYVGVGGSYAIGEDGIRRPVYEKFLNAQNKERYRPVK